MALPLEKEWNYADLLSWEDDMRYELIEGYPVMMAPGPSTVHQDILGELFAQFHAYLKGKRCKVYLSPFDVRLFEREGDHPADVDTVVQPDMTVVCDRSKVDQKGIQGAPDLIVEILSPSSWRHDCLVKYNLYQRAGVKEYWIVDTEKQVVLVHTLEEGQYHASKAYTARDTVPVGVLEDCAVDLTAVFPEE